MHARRLIGCLVFLSGPWGAAFAGENPGLKSSHWALNPPRRPKVPVARNRTWLRNPVDAFILSRLEAEGIEPSPEADRTTLIRRVSLDLIGLPPSPDEVAQF